MMEEEELVTELQELKLEELAIQYLSPRSDLPRLDIPSRLFQPTVLTAKSYVVFLYPGQRITY